MITLENGKDIEALLKRMKPGERVKIHRPYFVERSAMTNMIRNRARKEEERRKKGGQRIFFSYNEPFIECVNPDSIFIK